VEVKIGIQSVPRELIVETDTPAADIEKALAAALGDSSASLFRLDVRNGGTLLIPADKIAYVEFSAAEARRVGFGNIV
jgi:hypothetical protein